MGNEWKEIKLGEVIEVNPARPLSKSAYSVYISMQQVESANRTVNEIDRRKFKGSGSRFQNGDTLLARITPCLENGKTAFVDFLEEDEVAHGSTEFIVLSGVEGISDNLFVYYLARSPEFRDFAIVRMEGSSGRQRVPAPALGNYTFACPSYDEQRAIAHILGSLDDKIELNRKMNETLEAMAQAIFKSWFIDFDPVIDNALISGNPIPEKFTERTETRLKMLDQNQPSPPTPLPKGEGSGNYRGGYVFSGLLETARELKRKQTPAEEIMWAMIRNRNFMGLKFRRQHQIGDYIADFYCHEPRLVIELDGDVHHKKVNKDAKRDSYMQSLGLKVLRFPNSRIFEEIESVLTEIAHHISPSPSGRGGGEGSMDEIRRLFPDSFEESELGQIPKGWEISTIGANTEKLSKGTTPRKQNVSLVGGSPTVPFLKVRNISDSGEIDISSLEKVPRSIHEGVLKRSILKANDVLFSIAGTIGRVTILPMELDDSNTNQAVAFIRPQADGLPAQFMRLLLISDRIQFEAKSRVVQGVQANVSLTVLSELKFPKPTTELIDVWYRYCGDIFEQQMLLLKESRTLVSLRDTLLPKLISGEMRVPDAEKMLEAVK